MSTIWPLPKISSNELGLIEEKRPVALLTSEATWNEFGHLLNLPLVVQAEPTDDNQELMDFLVENLPSQVEVIYCLGSGVPVKAAKMVAHAHQLPLVIIPTAIDGDALFESDVLMMQNGLLNRIETGPATELILDWSLLEAAPPHRRGVGIVDVLAIVTALLDWRYAAKHNSNIPEHKFSAWGAGVAAGLASQAIKSAKSIGAGEVEGLKTLVNLLMMSVQLGHQLGHHRHQEGTEHYFVYALKNQGAAVDHADALATGIIFASILHGQSPNALQEAMTNAGVNVGQVRATDVQLAVNELPSFCVTNNFPHGIAHDIDPMSDQVGEALQKADVDVSLEGTGGWTAIPSEETTEETTSEDASTTEQPSPTSPAETTASAAAENASPPAEPDGET